MAQEEKDGVTGYGRGLQGYATAVKRHYTPKGDKIDRAQQKFLAEAVSKMAELPLLAPVAEPDSS